MPIKNMLNALDFLRMTFGDIGHQQMMILLSVMNEEGISQMEIVERYGLKQGSVSKNMRRLATHEGPDGKVTGLDLIEMKPDPVRYRRLALYLTSRGKQIKRRLVKELEE